MPLCPQFAQILPRNLYWRQATMGILTVWSIRVSAVFARSQ